MPIEKHGHSNDSHCNLVQIITCHIMIMTISRCNLQLIPYCPKFSRDLNFANRLKVDCLRLYFHKCMEAISLGSQAKKSGVIPFTCLGEDLE